jgi:hypothetical protein
MEIWVHCSFISLLTYLISFIFPHYNRAVSTTPNERDYLDRNSDSTFFSCLDTINAIISGIWIAVQTPLGVRLFQINAIICDAMCVGTLSSNRTGFLIPWCIASSLMPFSSCLFRANLEWKPHTQALTAIGSRLFATGFFG